MDKVSIGQYLGSGPNILAIKGSNEGTIANPAGILLGMRITTGQNDTLTIYSNQEWKSTAETPSGEWNTLNYDDSQWQQVKNYGSKHWDRLVNLSFDQDTDRFARASLVRQHPFMKALGRPTRENVTTSRTEQATLLQALELTNGTYFNDILNEGASRWLVNFQNSTGQIPRHMFQKAFGRDPNKQEMKVIHQTFGESPDQEAVQDLLWATLLSPEFQFIY